MLMFQSPGIYGFSFIWFGHRHPSIPLEAVISLFRGLIKSAPNLLQTARKREGCLLYGTGGNASCAQCSQAEGFTVCITPWRITCAVSLIPNFKLFPGLCVS